VSTPSTFAPIRRSARHLRRFVGIAAASWLTVLIAAGAYWYSRRDAVLTIETPELPPGQSVVLELTRTSYSLWNGDEKLEFTFVRPGRYELHPKPGDYYATIYKRGESDGYRLKRGEDQPFVNPHPRVPVPCRSVELWYPFRLSPGESEVMDVTQMFRRPQE
jgi:hypothetical protein